MSQANTQFAVSDQTSGHPLSKIMMFVAMSLLWMAFGLIVIHVGSATLQPVFAQIADSASATVDNDTTSELRYTALGWQDPGDWMPQPQQGSPLNLSAVSPLIWTALILLAVGIAFLWFSSDDEVDRLFKEGLEKADLLDQWESKQA